MASSNQLTPHQKLSLGVFLVIGMITFVFGAARLQKSIVLPFFHPKSSYVFKTADELEVERLALLKSEDTDKDGISDYDELYIFRTSPFLEDSDSDGFKDGEEIAQAMDPNCPKGKTCREVSSASTTTPTSPTGLDSGFVPVSAPAPSTTQTGSEAQIMAAIIETFGDPSTLTPEKIAEQLKAMSSPDLRAFLLKIGIPKTALDKADDATLRQLLQETLQEMSTTNGQAPPTQ